MDFQLAAGQIVFKIKHTASREISPACSAVDLPIRDRLPGRRQHLNFSQFKAIIEVLAQRVGCQACEKATQVTVPWARSGCLGDTRLPKSQRRMRKVA